MIDCPGCDICQPRDLEQLGYLCIQDHPNRICSGCTTACREPVFGWPVNTQPRKPCPLCGTLVDEDGYCVDVGCRNCGKAV